MADQIRGMRPRPRVAVLGDIDEEGLEKFQALFPTVWDATHAGHLGARVQAVELDLLVIVPPFRQGTHIREYMDSCHVICFSPEISVVPGPTPNTDARVAEEKETEEYLLPTIPLLLNRRRSADLADLTSAKGWLRLEVVPRAGVPVKELELAREIFASSAIVSDSHDNAPLAVIYTRQETALGVAWLPNDKLDRPKWVEAITMLWANDDSERFALFGDWTTTPEWMAHEERKLWANIQEQEERKLSAIAHFDQEIADLSSELTKLAKNMNETRRRLITAQGDDLVSEVKAVFVDLGFGVTDVDAELDMSVPKREDLRLTDSKDPGWEAIVEVRGYQRSGGKTSDLQRLSRFAYLYEQEKGTGPSRRVYVINGQTELPPAQREVPLAAATEDLQEFATDGGVVISSLDLYKIANELHALGRADVRASIRKATGRWIFAED